ncbi:MAG: alpha/beta hydrolase [Saprospiraceae bacterium]|nr:alpha/beta hydrolase [Saprospiraceae bacterium]
MNLLLLHGNGGASSRFRIFEQMVKDREPGFQVFLPALPGFEGRSLLRKQDQWEPFLSALAQTVASSPEDDWVYYGHGIGGSILLEWAARNWQTPMGVRMPPKAVVLHSCIGASLEKRFFPKLMKPLLMRQFIHRLIGWRALQPFWEKKLFLQADRIPIDLRNQFFEDYRTCIAFPVFFDMITPRWYQSVQKKLKDKKFQFLWGGKERVVASRFVLLWQRGFPNSEFKTIDSWDHFPMLEQSESFYQEITQLIDQLPDYE